MFWKQPIQNVYWPIIGSVNVVSKGMSQKKTLKVYSSRIQTYTYKGQYLNELSNSSRKKQNFKSIWNVYTQWGSLFGPCTSSIGECKHLLGTLTIMRRIISLDIHRHSSCNALPTCCAPSNLRHPECTQLVTYRRFGWQRSALAVSESSPSFLAFLYYEFQHKNNLNM